VILVDTNLLLYATFTGAAEHDRARRWLQEAVDDPSRSVVLCWPVLYAFVRLVTSARVFGEHALGVATGWATAAAFLAQPGVRMIVQGEGHAAIATELLSTPGLRSEDVPDVELAALAIEHGLVLASHDSGFRRFAGLRFVDPLR
jgi:toxin-antitoxin system PIN domain toxin